MKCIFTNSSSFPKSALLEISLGQQREAEEKWSVLQSHSFSEKKKKKSTDQSQDFGYGADFMRPQKNKERQAGARSSLLSE